MSALKWPMLNAIVRLSEKRSGSNKFNLITGCIFDVMSDQPSCNYIPGSFTIGMP